MTWTTVRADTEFAPSSGELQRPTELGRHHRSLLRKLILPRVVTLAVIVGTIVFIAPVLFTFVSSFRTAQDVANGPLSLPRHFTFANFSAAVKDIRYFTSVLNTLGITVGSCVGIVLLGSLASYPLARIGSRFSVALYRTFILGMTIPVFTLIGPLYLLMRDLHLLDSRIGLIFLYAAFNLPVAIFFYTSFIRQIPRDLEDAAMLDGAGPIRIFFKIIFPLLKPITGTILIFVSLFIWNDLALPLVFITDPAKSTVMANAYSFANPYTLLPTQIFPAAILGAVPLFILFLIFHRQVVSGITHGAVK